MNASEIKQCLKVLDSIGDTPVIEGLHGIGKTSVVKQYCKENNYHYEELILSLKDPSDLLGMPDRDDKDGEKSTIFLQPDWLKNIREAAWPKECDATDLIFNDNDFEKYCETQFDMFAGTIYRNSLNQAYCRFYKLPETKCWLYTNQTNVQCLKSRKSVLFLDELNRALQDTRQTSLQLILEKRLHTHELPYVNGEKTFIVVAINPSDSPEMDYQTYDLDAALFDRMTYLSMEVSQSDFLKHARLNQFSEVIIDYIAENPSHLWYINKKSNIGSTPRSWEVVSDILKSNSKAPEFILNNLICGRLGEEVGFNFMVFYKNYVNVVKTEDIINIVKDNSDKSVQEIGDLLKKFSKDKKLETIKITDLFNSLVDNAKDELKQSLITDNTSSILCWLCSMNDEVVLGVLKDLKAKRDNNDDFIYGEIVKLDVNLNNKELLKKSVKYSN